MQFSVCSLKKIVYTVFLLGFSHMYFPLWKSWISFQLYLGCIILRSICWGAVSCFWFYF